MSDEQFINGKRRDVAVEALAVERFSKDMQRKLSENSHKDHWSKADYLNLIDRVFEEADELKSAVLSYYFSGAENDQEIIDECADVALFAMFIADNIRSKRDEGVNKVAEEDQEFCKDCARRKADKSCPHDICPGDHDWCSAFKRKV